MTREYGFFLNIGFMTTTSSSSSTLEIRELIEVVPAAIYNIQ